MRSETKQQAVDHLEDDLDRIACEDNLRQAMLANDFERIEHWVDECRKYRKIPSTKKLIKEAYAKLSDL